MSEASDDAPLAAKEEAAPQVGAEAAPDDDVEVLVHPPEAEAEPQATPRHDSVMPTSRKLAPPPKPKRDSQNPSVPPPGGASTPSTPSISFQDGEVASRDPVAAALASNDSLRVIGEALAKDAGAFSTTEMPTGGRLAVPRPRAQSSATLDDDTRAGTGPDTRASRSPSEPPGPREKSPSAADDAPGAPVAAAPKSGSIFAQRIISVGTPSERAPAPPPAPAPVSPAQDLERTLEAAPDPVPTPLGFVTGLIAPPPFVEPPAPAAIPAAAVSAPPVAVAPLEAPPVEASPGDDEHGIPPITVEIPVDDSPPDIPITTDEDEETPTDRSASSAPLEAPPPASAAPFAAPPPIPVEPTPAPPAFVASPAAPPLSDVLPAAPSAPPAAVAALTADAPLAPAKLTPDEAPPDSLDRIQVEELSREDSPSVPPEEPQSQQAPQQPQAPPPLPARAEAKAPPPPPKRAPGAPPAGAEVAGETEKKKSKQKRPWWEELFSEDFVRANWKVSDEQIKREVTFVEESLGVAPGGVVLDLGCGSGQHAVELASRGYGVVGYDLSLYQLALAAESAQERSQKINFLQGDMREMAFEEMFDGIFCWNTSFGYFEEDKNFSVAERAFRALRPGGMFLVDVINRDFVAAHTPSSVWFEGDACVCMDDAVIDYFTSRLRVKRSVILDDGRTRECTYSVRLYSFHELGKLLHEVGFRVTEVSGHPATPGVFLGQASPRILMLAQRP